MALQNMAFKLELLTDLGTCKAGYSPVREKWNLGCARQKLIYQPHRQSECFLHTVPVTTHLPCEHTDWPEFCLHGPSDVYQPSCMTEYGSSLHFTFDWEGSNSKNQIWLGVGEGGGGGGQMHLCLPTVHSEVYANLTYPKWHMCKTAALKSHSNFILASSHNGPWEWLVCLI